ncbi:MAG: hypothetical protein ACRYF3_17510, partial [Janthinobacterium lividum]
CREGAVSGRRSMLAAGNRSRSDPPTHHPQKEHLVNNETTTVAPEIAASRAAWVAWLRGDDTAADRRLIPALLHTESRDALMVYPHRGSWDHTDPTRGRTWSLSEDELSALWCNGAPDETLSNRIIDGLDKILDRDTNTDSEHAVALAVQGFLAWDAENVTTASLWVSQSLQHDPNLRLARLVDAALSRGILPYWRK